MRIYIVRHGETDWNKDRRVQGRSNIQLNEFGRVLARKTAEGLKDIPFDAAYSSQLDRAKETAQIIIGDRDIPLMIDERIQEMSFGEYEGLYCHDEEFIRENPDFSKFFECPEDYMPPEGGETFLQVRERAGMFLKELFENEAYQDATILIATHGGVICAMLNYMKDHPISAYWEGGVHRNCEVTIVDVKNQKPTIVEEGIVYYDDEVEPW